MTSPETMICSQELAGLEKDGLVHISKLHIGQKIYFPVNDPHDSAEIISVTFAKYGLITYDWAEYEHRPDEPDELWDSGQFYEAELNKNVFLTREDAQNELKLRLKDGTTDF